MLFALDICVNKKAPLTQCALGSQLSLKLDIQS